MGSFSSIPFFWLCFNLLCTKRSDYRRYVLVATLCIGFWLALALSDLGHTVEGKKLIKEGEGERERERKREEERERERDQGMYSSRFHPLNLLTKPQFLWSGALPQLLSLSSSNCSYLYQLSGSHLSLARYCQFTLTLSTPL